MSDRQRDRPQEPTKPHAYLREDAFLGPLVEEFGTLTLDPAPDLFTRLVTSILRQQVSMASAAATRERLFDALDAERLDAGEEIVTPGAVLAADESTLKDAGLSRQKVRYVREVARAFDDHGYDADYFAGMDDEAVRSELTAITGVGEWTANMQLMFGLGREDVFPVGDLGIRKGMETLFEREMTRVEMREAAERWAPYRSYASLYVWRAEEDVVESVAEVGGEE